MTRFLFCAAALALLSACGDDTPANNTAAATAKGLEKGEYEIVTTVKSLASTDKTTPATDWKAGSTATARVCFAGGDKPTADFFTAKGDSCEDISSFVTSGGMLSMQVRCTRPKNPGFVMISADGQLKPGGFETTGTVNTSFSGSGDYTAQIAQKATRVGDCSAAATTPKKA
ncbi:DUF3617 family protein [Sphingomonas ginkgonis]|uniref:DUF3617 family protein n=1 Tax=Sphingomonas ginkgonis TaxID=2315330 RepID=A0A3S0EKW9_9SPHN|nr:DUF3617 family protein [Sphingomonas ginkgonis]RST29983.1 DUF3617 family protein [Sphingomonas ginkgonis]